MTLSHQVFAKTFAPLITMVKIILGFFVLYIVCVCEEEREYRAQTFDGLFE